MMLLATPSGAGGQSSGSSTLVSFGTFALLFVVMYVFLIRPQSKKRKEQQAMLKGAAVGDSIVTIGGLHGTITHVEETYVIIKVDDNTKLKYSREAIQAIVSRKGDAEKSTAKAAEKPSEKVSEDTSKDETPSVEGPAKE